MKNDHGTVPADFKKYMDGIRFNSDKKVDNEHKTDWIMKKFFYFAFCVLLSGALTTGCSSDGDDESDDRRDKTYTPSDDTLFADEYTDPATHVRYTLNHEESTAEVRCGHVQPWDIEYVYEPGSPDVDGRVSILEKISVNGREYRVTRIGEFAFSMLDKLTQVSIPASVKEIGREAFAGCANLESVDMKEGLKEICQEAFRNCNSLLSMNLPSGLGTIGFASFSNCLNLEAIRIPRSATDIHITAFEGCDALCSIVVEEGNAIFDSREGCNAIIKTADNTLVVGCKGTQIPLSVTKIGPSAFQLCRGLQSIFIPGSVVSIDDHAFAHCTQLKAVTLPDGLKTIGQSVFWWSGLSELTIPASVRSIGACAFWMPGLKKLTSLIENPMPTFKICDLETTSPVLYVPKGAVERYKATSSWNEFLEIRELNW